MQPLPQRRDLGGSSSSAASSSSAPLARPSSPSSLAPASAASSAFRLNSLPGELQAHVLSSLKSCGDVLRFCKSSKAQFESCNEQQVWGTVALRLHEAARRRWIPYMEYDGNPASLPQQTVWSMRIWTWGRNYLPAASIDMGYKEFRYRCLKSYRISRMLADFDAICEWVKRHGWDIAARKRDSSSIFEFVFKFIGTIVLYVHRDGGRRLMSGGPRLKSFIGDAELNDRTNDAYIELMHKFTSALNTNTNIKTQRGLYSLQYGGTPDVVTTLKVVVTADTVRNMRGATVSPIAASLFDRLRDEEKHWSNRRELGLSK